MSKFHINKYGVPAPCKAKQGNCPLGGDDIHFNNFEEAQGYANKINSGKSGTLSHPLGNAGRSADSALEKAFDNANSYGSGSEVNLSAADTHIIEGAYFDRDSHPRPRISGFFNEIVEKRFNSHEEAFNSINDGEDAIDEVELYYSESMSDPEERYKALTQAKALNDMYKDGTKLAYQVSKEVQAIADKENLSQEERNDLYEYMSNRFNDSLHNENLDTETGVAKGSGRMKNVEDFQDDRVPLFYHMYDSPSSTLDETIDEGLDWYEEDTGRPRSEIDNDSRQEQFEAAMEMLDESHYKNAYNQYSEKRFNNLSEKMAEHYELHGISTKEEAKSKINEIGKKEFNREFNDFVFDRKKPEWSQ